MQGTPSPAQNIRLPFLLSNPRKKSQPPTKQSFYSGSFTTGVLRDREAMMHGPVRSRMATMTSAAR